WSLSPDHACPDATHAKPAMNTVHPRCAIPDYPLGACLHCACINHILFRGNELQNPSHALNSLLPSAAQLPTCGRRDLLAANALESRL
ncbi:MAG: hypothetical protein Q8N54_04435, partial [Sulfurimicrobium sp.]|nr:hypothetical protein [Sulfurimicrobium sp.]